MRETARRKNIAKYASKGYASKNNNMPARSKQGSRKSGSRHDTRWTPVVRAFSAAADQQSAALLRCAARSRPPWTICCKRRRERVATPRQLL
jgi:hypothetical protein